MVRLYLFLCTDANNTHATKFEIASALLRPLYCLRPFPIIVPFPPSSEERVGWLARHRGARRVCSVARESEVFTFSSSSLWVFSAYPNTPPITRAGPRCHLRGRWLSRLHRMCYPLRNRRQPSDAHQTSMLLHALWSPVQWIVIQARINVHLTAHSHAKHRQTDVHAHAREHTHTRHRHIVLRFGFASTSSAFLF